MSRSIIFLLLFFNSFLAYSQEVNCFKNDEVKISNVYPNIKFPKDSNRKDFIKIRKMIDCKTKAEIIPDTYQEAITMLSFSLPTDYLMASIVSFMQEGEANMSIYMY